MAKKKAARKSSRRKKKSVARKTVRRKPARKTVRKKSTRKAKRNTVAYHVSMIKGVAEEVLKEGLYQRDQAKTRKQHNAAVKKITNARKLLNKY